MNPSNRSRCSEYLRVAARQIDAGAIEEAAESLRISLLLMWDRESIVRRDSLLTVTHASRAKWLEERAT